MRDGVQADWDAVLGELDGASRPYRSGVGAGGRVERGQFLRIDGVRAEQDVVLGKADSRSWP